MVSLLYPYNHQFQQLYYGGRAHMLYSCENLYELWTQGNNYAHESIIIKFWEKTGVIDSSFPNTNTNNINNNNNETIPMTTNSNYLVLDMLDIMIIVTQTTNKNNEGLLELDQVKGTYILKSNRDI